LNQLPKGNPKIKTPSNQKKKQTLKEKYKDGKGHYLWPVDELLLLTPFEIFFCS